MLRLRSASLRSFGLYHEETTAYGLTYIGAAEEATVSWRSGPEQFDPFSSWMKNYFVSHLQTEVEKHGGKVLKVSIYRDKAPTFYTSWRCVITADVTGEIASVQQAGLQNPFPWLAILAVVLVGFILKFTVKPTIDSIRKLFWGSGNGTSLLSNPVIIVIAGVILLAWAPWKTEKGAS